MENLKPFLNQFIQFYYYDLLNRSGGNLHIALDDGNLSKGNINFCQEEAEKNNDSFGIFLARLMREFTEEELEELYEKDWFGMDKENLFKKGLKYEVHKFILGPYERFNITATLKNKGEIKKLLDQDMLEYCKETKISISMVPARTLLIIDFSIFRRKDHHGNWIFREQMPLNFEI